MGSVGKKKISTYTHVSAVVVFLGADACSGDNTRLFLRFGTDVEKQRTASIAIRILY